MDISKKLPPVIKITKYTLIDEFQHKSFIIMFVICALFVFLLRGCYQGDYTVNGHHLDAGTIVKTLSTISFHVIGVGVMVITALLSMRIFRRDRSEGTLSFVLSKPISRWQYITGKIVGLWALSVVFMLSLHSIVFLITFINVHILMPEYLIASLLSSINLLFVIITVLLLSLLMPDIIAFLCVLFVGVVGFVADGIVAASHSQMAKAIIQQSGAAPETEFTWWKGVYTVWPKLLGVQQLASSLSDGDASHGFGPAYPLVNILLYCLVFGALLFRRFNNEDIV